jgi:flagellar basal-body rod protein FlgB
MIENTIFAASHLAALKRALTVYAERHQVVADNIANVETPGYQAREYRFEEYLRGAEHRLQGTRTRPGHLAIGGRDPATAEGREALQESDFDNGVNNVDIDREMTGLVTADLSYRLATRLLSMKYRLLRGAITGQLR